MQAAVIPHKVLTAPLADKNPASITRTPHSICSHSIVYSARPPQSKSDIPKARFDYDSTPEDAGKQCAAIPHKLSTPPMTEKNPAITMRPPQVLKIPALFQKATACFLGLIGRTSVEASKVESPAAIPLASAGPATTISSIPSTPATSAQLYSVQAAQVHAAPTVASPPVVTSADSPIDLDFHKPNTEIILAASAASAVSESQTNERLMIKIIAGPYCVQLS